MVSSPRLIAVQLRPSEHFVSALEAIWDRGDVVLPLSPRLPVARRDTLLATFHVGELWEDNGTHILSSRSNPALEPGDRAVMLTSGTTGEPKGVIHTQESIAAASSITAEATTTTATSHWVCCLPVNHVGGFSVITRAKAVGAFIDLIASPTTLALQHALESGATHVSIVPSLLDRIDHTQWQLILTGGSQSPNERPDNVIATYGLTETFGGVVYNGVALSGVEMKTSSNSSTPSPLSLRTPTLGRGYLQGQVVSAIANSNGWFTTSDLATLDSAHILTIHGRSDDVIVSGGENVWPDHIEAALQQHPSIAEAAVIGLPSKKWGEIVTVAVVVHSGVVPPSLDELQELLRNDFAPYEIPRSLFHVDALPRTDIGKLQRSILKHHLLSQAHVQQTNVDPRSEQ